jgi:5-methylcytosine-specific restriction endonuclease McrA
MPNKIQSASAPGAAGASASPRSAFDARRGSSCKRGYGRRWEKLRKLVLHRDPLCTLRNKVLQFAANTDIPEPLRRELAARSALLCNGMNLSAHVDHFIPKPAGDDSENNLNGGCASCHSIKTTLLDLLIVKAVPWYEHRG